SVNHSRSLRPFWRNVGNQDFDNVPHGPLSEDTGSPHHLNTNHSMARMAAHPTTLTTAAKQSARRPDQIAILPRLAAGANRSAGGAPPCSTPPFSLNFRWSAPPISAPTARSRYLREQFMSQFFY